MIKIIRSANPLAEERLEIARFFGNVAPPQYKGLPRRSNPQLRHTSFDSGNTSTFPVPILTTGKRGSSKDLVFSSWSSEPELEFRVAGIPSSRPYRQFTQLGGFRAFSTRSIGLANEIGNPQYSTATANRSPSVVLPEA